jgi:hypothetical protein
VFSFVETIASLVTIANTSTLLEEELEGELPLPITRKRIMMMMSRLRQLLPLAMQPETLKSMEQPRLWTAPSTALSHADSFVVVTATLGTSVHSFM